MIVAFIYVLIAAFLMSAFIIASAKVEGKVEFRDEDCVSFVICFALWPLTIIFLGLLTAFEMYKSMLKKQVMNYVPGNTRLDLQLNELSLKQLKVVIRAERIGAIHLGEKAKEQARKIITDRAFEDNFLGKQ
jgi:hypothetical protein